MYQSYGKWLSTNQLARSILFIYKNTCRHFAFEATQIELINRSFQVH